ncbi:MAG: type II toxin-antitoxin system VapC family toxin [Spirochaetaceae bacterium]
MRVGVDTSVIVAAVHANHPLHGEASAWLDAAFSDHEIVVTHHSLLETYAVLTRLPAPYRFAPGEAQMVLRETLQDNAQLAAFDAPSAWEALDSVGRVPAAGGESYDAFIIYLLLSAGVELIVTYNVRELRRLGHGVRIACPKEA